MRLPSQAVAPPEWRSQGAARRAGARSALERRLRDEERTADVDPATRPRWGGGAPLRGLPRRQGHVGDPQDYQYKCGQVLPNPRGGEGAPAPLGKRPPPSVRPLQRLGTPSTSAARNLEAWCSTREASCRRCFHCWCVETPCSVLLPLRGPRSNPGMRDDTAMERRVNLRGSG